MNYMVMVCYIINIETEKSLVMIIEGPILIIMRFYGHI